MTTYAYFASIPVATNYPGDDQPNMQTNYASIAGLIATDHVGFNTAGGGKHEQSTYIQQTVKPVVSGTDSAVYAKLTGSISQLFFEDQNGLEYQLTGTLTATGSGGPPPTYAGQYIFAGGFIVKWGNTIVNTSTTIINFPIAFPTACYGVQMTVNNTAAATQSIVTDSYPSTTGFTARINGPSSVNCSWWAWGT